jgi:hypothetical protein
LILLAILIAGTILLAPYVPLNQIKPDIEAILSQHLGRKVTIGRVHLSLVRGPALVIEDLRASEDPEFGSGNTIEAGTVRVGIAIGPLISSRRFIPTDLKLENPRLSFTRNSRGAWSWSTLGEASSRAALLHGQAAAGDCRMGLFVQAARTAWLPTVVSTLLDSSGDVPALKSVELQRASVTLVQGGDPERDKPNQTSFDNIDLRASLSPQPAEPRPSTHATGRIRASSEQTETSDLLAADLPFDVTTEVADVGGFTVSGAVGPGKIKTTLFDAQDFKASVTVNGNIARFDDVQASLFEGQLRGGLQLDLAATRPRFALEGNLGNINIDQSVGTWFRIPGAVTGHINGDFKIIGLMGELQRSFPSISGDGRLSADDLFISNINLSEQVAKRLGISQIGNMAPGTNIGHVDQQFRIFGGTITIQNLHVTELDGLGDATTDRATINVKFDGGRPGIQLDFPTTVTLSPDSAARAKQASPLFALAAALLERSNQLSVPIHVTGDLSNPQVLVDLPRILQSIGRP